MSERDHPDGAPPFLGTWRNVYLLVIGELLLLILLFKLFMKAFA